VRDLGDEAVRVARRHPELRLIPSATIRAAAARSSGLPVALDAAAAGDRRARATP
jgi:hypothetical protein